MSEDTKTIKVIINDVEEIIEYKTDLTFGEVQEIKKKTYHAKNPFEVEFDSELYQRLVFEKAIIKAPFKTADWTTIYQIKGDVITDIMTVLMDTFPLGRYFKPLEKMLKKID